MTPIGNKKRAPSGVLNCHEIRGLIDDELISSREDAIEERQVQPASLDLRLGKKAYRVLSSFLPERAAVLDRLMEPDRHGANLVMYELDISEPCVLEKGQVYLIPLMEELKLPKNVRGRANPKSTTGRLDIFTRVITDRNNRFDDIPAGYRGKLFVEVMPRSFAVKAKAGQSLVQLRLIRGGDAAVSDARLHALHAGTGLLFAGNKPLSAGEININRGVFMSLDLSGDNSRKIVGYKSKKNSHCVDLSKVGGYPMEAFWEPICRDGANDTLILEPEDFYILASKERIRIPLGYAAEMVPYEVGFGELRTHYAGFFDPGFGYGKKGEIKGTKAVLEVRARDIPFMVRDGQTFCKLYFEKMTEAPDKVYGVDIGSSYQLQGIKLSKQFRDG
jgi:dCTP deaminase